MNKYIFSLTMAAFGMLALGITAAQIGAQTVAAQGVHGDEVSSAAKIIGPEIKADAQLQKDPGSVSDAAKIIGPEISAIAQPLTKK